MVASTKLNKTNTTEREYRIQFRADKSQSHSNVTSKIYRVRNECTVLIYATLQSLLTQRNEVSLIEGKHILKSIYISLRVGV